MSSITHGSGRSRAAVVGVQSQVRSPWRFVATDGTSRMSRSPPYSARPNHIVRRSISGANQSNAAFMATFREPGNTGAPTFRAYASLKRASHRDASPFPACTRPMSRVMIRPFCSRLRPASPFVTNVRELNPYVIRVLDVHLILAFQRSLCLGHGFLECVQRRLRVVLLDAEAEVTESWLRTRIRLVDAQEATFQPEFAEVLVLSPDWQTCKALVERFRACD